MNGSNLGLRLLGISAGNGSASATYTYDANGLRVKKAIQSGTATVYVFSGTKVIAEYENGAAPSSPMREYIYSGSALVAKIEGGSTVYYHPDQLSERVTTNSSGTLAGQQGHYPFGESWYGSSTTTKWQFTSYERDAESGNDYAMARYDVDRLGRFSSPDPMGGSSGDPQSLNRYAYVENDPIDLTDPTGLCPPWGPYTPTGQHPADGISRILCREVEWVGLGVFFDWAQSFELYYGDGRYLTITIPAVGSGTTRVDLPGTGGKPQAQQKQNIFTCAAGIGDKYSIAGGLHALGIATSGIGGFITDALGGNAFSGATNLIASLGSGAAGGHNVFYNMAQGVVAGPGQGVLPPGINGPWGASGSGLATDAIAKTAWSSVTGAGQTLTTLGGEASLASTAISAAEFASGVAAVKYGYDALSYVAGLAVCAAR